MTKTKNEAAVYAIFTDGTHRVWSFSKTLTEATIRAKQLNEAAGFDPQRFYPKSL